MPSANPTSAKEINSKAKTQHSALSTQPFYIYAGLFVLALLLRLVAALVVRQPGFVDAYYYYQVAANWQAGKGLTETTIWNYQAGGLFDPTVAGQLDHPAFTYWTPLASFLPMLSFSLFGVSFWAASLPFMLCAAALPPLAFWLGRLAFGPAQRRYSWTMALVMLFPGRYFLFWNAPDNFAPFALVSLLALAAIYGGLHHDDRWLLAAGGLLGLAYLSRSDGILLTVTLVLCFLLRRWQLRAISYQPSAVSHQPSAISRQPSAVSHQPSKADTQPSAISHQPSADQISPSSSLIPHPSSLTPTEGSQKGSTQHSALSTQGFTSSFILHPSSLPSKPRWWMLGAALALALLVVAPWLGRNLAQFGSLFPANNLKVIYLRNYQEFFSYGLNLDANYYFSWGLGNIIWHKLSTLGINALLLIFQGLFLLGPLFVAGLWAVRKRAAFWPFMIYTAVLYLVMSVVFSEIGSHGTIFHSAGGLIPFQAGAALAGLEWLGRGKPRPRAASIMVLVALAVTVYFVTVQQAPGWDNDYNAALKIEKWFNGNAAPKDVIMVGEPLSFNYATGRPAISQASDGLEANLAALKRYKARWFVLGPERYNGLDDLYHNKRLATNGLDLRLAVELDDGIQIYEVILK